MNHRPGPMPHHRFTDTSNMPSEPLPWRVDPATDPDTVTIVITWVEPSLGEDPQVYTTSFQV